MYSTEYKSVRLIVLNTHLVPKHTLQHTRYSDIALLPFALLPLNLILSII